MATKSIGGYNIEVLYEPDKERFKCSLCLGIIKIATHGCMNHVFCKECIEEYIERNRGKEQLLCPAGCRVPFDKDKLQSSKPVDQFINTIACKCPDCSWTGDLLDFVQQHELNCEEMRVLCDLCDEFIKRKDFQSHVSQTCRYRKIECQYCSKELPYCKHISHEEICQNTEVDCFYRKFGCTEKIKRKLMDLHIEKNNQKHLHLVTMYFVEENRCLQFANKELVLKNEELEAENLGINHLLNKMDKKIEVMTLNCENHAKEIFQLKTEKNLHRETFLRKDSTLYIGGFSSEKLLKGFLEFWGNCLQINKCSLSKIELIRSFDTKDFLSISKNITEQLHFLNGCEDVLVELMSSKPLIQFHVKSAFNIVFFKTKICPEHDKGVLKIPKKVGDIYYCDEKVYHPKDVLLLLKWKIELSEKPIDLSQPDERFKLADMPFTNDCYGCVEYFLDDK